MSNPHADGVVRLADYRAPAWRITHAELTFDLDFATSEVAAKLHLQPDPGQPGSELRLDGEALELLDIRLDGQPLALDRFVADADGLLVRGVTGPCVLETRVRIRPDGNTELEGLYRSGDILITQCEAEGFRRITYFTDRPDVMPTWRTTLRADPARFPVLLANGNPRERGRLDDGRHYAVWDNPHPTPSYLFALVAGPLQSIDAVHTTAEQREVKVAVWAAATDLPRCAYALGAVLRAMAWDERRFGRSYDLEAFNVVAVQDFTMGAMENKGLNIFNARYVLADPDTATDADHLGIESVVGHEYFHNWSGNRVTLRDWFQLSLKEGFTVFRDQEFSADLHSRSVRRIEVVRVLRARQFAEDGGPLAHPVRPASYREINNCYTLTIYEKGAELVRMLHTLLGEAAFRAGADRYFADNDGRAATVEDFLAAHARASGRDLGQFARWYAQAGTPELRISDDFDAATGTYTLAIDQHTPPTPGQTDKLPLHIPLRWALYDERGLPLALTPTATDANTDTDADADADADAPALVELTTTQTMLCVTGLRAPPLPAFNQGFGAPVQVHYAYTPDQLGRLARAERDPFNRWDALQRLALGVLLRRFPDAHAAHAALTDALGALLDDATADPAFVAECLQLPDFDTLAEAGTQIDVDALLAARDELLDQLAEAHAQRLESRYEQLHAAAGATLDGPAMAARRLRNGCLALLTRLDPSAARATAQFDAARGMTERLGALRLLIHFDAPNAAAARAQFCARYAADPLVTDKWLLLVATRPQPDAVAAVRELLTSAWWKPTNPNRVRAIVGSFSRMNPVAFHRADGAGYALVCEQLPILDAINPQVAARVLGGFESWHRLTDPRRAHAQAALAALDGKLVSRDCRDLLGRLLA